MWTFLTKVSWSSPDPKGLHTFIWFGGTLHEMHRTIEELQELTLRERNRGWHIIVSSESRHPGADALTLVNQVSFQTRPRSQWFPNHPDQKLSWEFLWRRQTEAINQTLSRRSNIQQARKSSALLARKSWDTGSTEIQTILSQLVCVMGGPGPQSSTSCASLEISCCEAFRPTWTPSETNR